jgi:hypothetical protein
MTSVSVDGPTYFEHIVSCLQAAQMPWLASLLMAPSNSLNSYRRNNHLLHKLLILDDFDDYGPDNIMNIKMLHFAVISTDFRSSTESITVSRLFRAEK